jgi:hypothetical protein
MLLAEGYRSSGRLDAAAAAARAMLDGTTQNSQIYLLLGSILRQQNKLERGAVQLRPGPEVETG